MINIQIGDKVRGTCPGEIYTVISIENGLAKLTADSIGEAATYFEYVDRLQLIEKAQPKPQPTKQKYTPAKKIKNLT